MKAPAIAELIRHLLVGRRVKRPEGLHTQANSRGRRVVACEVMRLGHSGLRATSGTRVRDDQITGTCSVTAVVSPRFCLKHHRSGAGRRAP